MSDTSEQSDESLAAAWGSDTDADSAANGAQAARVLNQAEIDSLLGFDNGPSSGEARTGMQKIISSGLVSYERLPMLEIVFDRLVRIMSTSLRNFTSDNVEVGIDNIISLRFGDYLNSIPLPAMLAVFKAEEWDNQGLMVIDSAMIYSIVDVLLGGRRGTAAMRIEGRPYTTIERTLVERLIQVVLTDLSTSFDPLCPVTFRFERLEVNPRFATISRLRTQPSWRACASTWKIAAAGSNCCCLTPPWNRSGSCCCNSSWAKNSAEIRSGKPILRSSFGTQRSNCRLCWMSTSCGCRRSSPCVRANSSCSTRCPAES
jgi:hypothetical protein